jgi:peptidoglycan-N-acetylglucosamine deacetylase
MFLYKSNILFKRIFPNFIWDLPAEKPTIYLTFDDGPIPNETEFVLDLLKLHDIKATFFCIGKNIVENPKIFNRIISNGHSIGNHTMNHLNGWATDNDQYIADFEKCKSLLPSTSLFRPPYGKISKAQSKIVQKNHKIIMWDVISGDFLPDLDPEICLQKCIKYTKSGTIIVFHDSIKASRIMRYVLPRYIAFFKEKGYEFESIKIMN